ncbi:Cell Wall Hydrolase [compost metagenome]
MAAGDCLTNKGSDEWDFSEFDGLDSVDLLARLIYSEASVESLTGKRGVYYVVSNRKAKNSSEFGGNTVAGVVLKKSQFSGMTTNNARCPDKDSTAWKDSLSVASNGGTNPIGKCLWFNGNDKYKERITTDKDGNEFYTHPGSTAKKVVEKVVIGKHTFWRVEGY